MACLRSGYPVDMKYLQYIQARLFAVLTTSVVSIMAVGCASSNRALVPGYEVLVSPTGATAFPVGAKWIQGVGPSGPSLGGVVTSPGAGNIASNVEIGDSGGLNSVLTSWVSAKLGADNEGVREIRAADLEHSTVEDPYAIGSSGMLLWEVVTAGSLEVELDESSGFQGALEVEEALARALEIPEISVEASTEAQRTYSVKSDRRLVVALRIVKFQTRNATRSVEADLSIGRQTVDVPFGYRVAVLDKMDRESSTVPVSVWNVTSANRGLASEAVLDAAAPIVTEVREDARSGLYVRDTIALRYNRDPRDCAIEVTRREIEIEPARSGLRSTR